MSSEEDKPPAPPVRLTSNRGGSDRLDGPPDLKPLPKGTLARKSLIEIKRKFISNRFLVSTLDSPINFVLSFVYRAGRPRSQEENPQKQDQIKTITQWLQAQHLVPDELWAHGARGLRRGDRRVHGKLPSLFTVITRNNCGRTQRKRNNGKRVSWIWAKLLLLCASNTERFRRRPLNCSLTTVNRTA